MDRGLSGLVKATMTAGVQSPDAAKDTLSGTPAIDLGKLRSRLRLLGDEYVFLMLHEAMELLPAGQLARLVSRYIDLAQLRPDHPTDAGNPTLLGQVKAFDSASRAGNYYEDFAVNSGNCTVKSPGTLAFIAECARLLDLCARESTTEAFSETRIAFEILFALLAYIDECHDDVVFFADEGGSWQVPVDWRSVFPAWFRCLCRSVGPDDYARLVAEMVDRFESHDRAGHLAAADAVLAKHSARSLHSHD